jgi:hypothetical protein
MFLKGEAKYPEYKPAYKPAYPGNFITYILLKIASSHFLNLI